MKLLQFIASVLVAFTGFSVTAADQNSASWLDKAVNHPVRGEQNKQRDPFRHPKQTLEFFGLKQDMTVVEIWPGGGWYTEILAPALHPHGQLIAAHFDPESKVKYYQNSYKKFKKKMASDPVYQDVKITPFKPDGQLDLKKESVDMVVTFRNVHNWYMRGNEQAVENAFKQFYRVLKHDGILGVVDHRMPKHMHQFKNRKSGYMKESLVVQMAVRAGFKLIKSSDINNNAKDSADHPKGVWTLPPSLRLGEQDKEKYLEIGESDRMTLKFVKPSTK